MVSATPASKMSDESREALAVMANSSSLPYRCVVRASGLLLAADGTPNAEIARRCKTTKDTVRRWRTKFESGGVDAVGTTAAGRGRKPEIADSTIEAIVSDTLHTVPDDGSVAWSTRTMAERHGVGKDTVQPSPTHRPTPPDNDARIQTPTLHDPRPVVELHGRQSPGSGANDKSAWPPAGPRR